MCSWWLPLRSYSRTRAWSDDDFDAATERLEARGLVEDGALTASGRELRESIEVRTDEQLAPAIDALGADAEELVDLLRPWGRAVRHAKGYPAAGPHDLATAAADS